MRRPRLSVIVPALDEAGIIAPTLARAAEATDVEVIVVDGGSTDRTRVVAVNAGAAVIDAAAGRAIQMNVGAAAARGEILVFLHADTRLPAGYDLETRRVLDDDGVAAGAFRLRIDGSRRAFRLIERAVNLRSRRLGLPYGDQALFLRRRTFDAAGGFPEIPVMEDFAFVRRVRRLGRVRLARSAVLTSPRRWERHGVWRVTARNQVAIAGFMLGVEPARLARMLGRDPNPRAAGASVATTEP